MYANIPLKNYPHESYNNTTTYNIVNLDIFYNFINTRISNIGLIMIKINPYIV